MKTIQPDPEPRGTNGSSDGLDDGERKFAFAAFNQAVACQASAVQCISAAMRHTTVATLAAGGGRADVHTALDALYQRLTLAMDGALIDAIGDISEHVE